MWLKQPKATPEVVAKLLAGAAVSSEGSTVCGGGGGAGV